MFIIIAGKANQGKTTTLKRLMESSKSNTACYISPEDPFSTSLFDLMMEKIKKGSKEFFIDDVSLFTWKGKTSKGKTSANCSWMENKRACLEDLEKMAKEFEVDIFVALQVARVGFEY